jgi:hypothetical protein
METILIVLLAAFLVCGGGRGILRLVGLVPSDRDEERRNRESVTITSAPGSRDVRSAPVSLQRGHGPLSEVPKFKSFDEETTR